MTAEDKEILKLVSKIAAGMLLAFFGSCAGCNAYEVVPPGHRGLIVHAGQVQDNVLGEGLVFKLPFYTTIQLVSLRVQQALTDTQAASKDMQKVHTKLALNWHFAPDQLVNTYRTLGGSNVEDMVIDRAVSEILKAATATMTAEEILVKRIQLKNMVDDALEKRLAQFGIIVDAVNLADFNFEADFNKAVEEKQVAEQKAKKAVYDAQRATQEAVAAVETAKGQAEAQRLLRASINETLIQRAAIEKWDGHLPSTLVTKDGSVPFLQQLGGK